MYRFLRSNTVEFYGLNCMALFKSYWTVQGISPDARDAAIRAAEADGEELGVWLSRLIHEVSTAERDNAAVQTVNDADADNEDDKLTSIERAMLQSSSTGNVGSA